MILFWELTQSLFSAYCGDSHFYLFVFASKLATLPNKNACHFVEGICDPDWIQTNDPKLRRFVLYSAELPGLLRGGKDRGYMLFGELKKDLFCSGSRLMTPNSRLFLYIPGILKLSKYTFTFPSGNGFLLSTYKKPMILPSVQAFIFHEFFFSSSQ